MLTVFGKPLLVLVTFVCLLSMGGAMMFAVWLLVPLHWRAARGSGPFATGGWAYLAGASVFEAAWMITYGVTEQVGVSFITGAVAAVATIAVFLRWAADRAAVVAH